MNENRTATDTASVAQTLVSLWHSGISYDWRVLVITHDALHLTYLGKPNLLLALLGPLGGIIMQVQARRAYKRAVAIPIQERADSHPKSIVLKKAEIQKIEGSGRKVSIWSTHGKTYKVVRMGDGDLLAMTERFRSE